MTSWQQRADTGDATVERPGALPQDAPARAELDIDAALLLASRMAALQRVVSHPGSGDRAFLREVRGARPELLTERQREHVVRLAWRYRFQLPPGLRPPADPDLKTQATQP